MTNYAYKKASYKWHTTMLVMILCLVVTYVWQTNNQVEQAFIIKDLEEKQQQLEDIIHDKQLVVSEARSLATIAQRAEELELENPEEITFLKVSLSSVAIEYDKEL